MLNKKRGVMAFSQILILIIGTVAIAWIIGMSLPLVSGLNNPTSTGLPANGQKKIFVPPEVKFDINKEIKFPVDGKDTIFSSGTINLNDKSEAFLGNQKVPINVLQQGLIDEKISVIDNGEYFFRQGANNYIATPGKEIENVGYGEWARRQSIAETGNAPGLFKPGGLFGEGTFSGALAGGLKWAGVVGGILGLASMFVPEKYKPVMNALTPALTAGSFWAGTLSKAFSETGVWGSWAAAHPTGAAWIQWGGAIGIAAIIFALLYKKEGESQELIKFECNPWDAPVGGHDCEKCNKQGILGCSEYQCRSLGQACVLENAGTEEEMCFWKHRDDVEPPIITLWNEALPDGYQYSNDKSVSPPDKGVKITNKEKLNGCVPAFFPLSFGITTNEPSRCKLDYTRKQKFDDMNFFFGGSSLFRYNHTQTMSLPGPSALKEQNLTMQNNGEFSLYTKCSDANGNINTWNYVFKFCVDNGPDTTPPLIVTTNLLNGMPVAYNQSSINLEVYVNEPATCKWSHRDQAYDKMEENMACSSSVFEMNSQMLYKCSTTLSGLKNSYTNDFYFRCKDKPSAPADRNVNTESYKFSLIGTRPLAIKSASPNNKTIKDATDVIKITLEVETSEGYEEGKAMCYYSDTGETDSYIMFFDTNNDKHKQELYLPEGNYKYWIRCIDLGGNPDEREISFSVDTDTQIPLIVRAFKEESYLRLITNEEAECVYDSVDCNYLFADGTAMTRSSEGENHFTDWNTNSNLYVKCRDKYKNEPLPNSCSIIIRPFEIYVQRG